MEKLIVEFKFRPEEKVITPFKDEGYVVMCGYRDDRVRYYIKRRDSGCWFYENELRNGSIDHDCPSEDVLDTKGFGE